MKLIIDIHEEAYKLRLTDPVWFDSNMDKAIRNGTPLPKGHGRLIDADELVYDCSLGEGGCDRICRCDGCSYHIISENAINKAPTIIEADKESDK